MDFSTRLKALRMRRSITQRQLASLVGVTAMTIRNWECSDKYPSMHAIISLCQILNVSADELLGIKPSVISDYPITPAESKLLNNYRLLDRHGKTLTEMVCAHEVERVNSISTNERQYLKMIPRYYTPSAAGYSAPIDGDDYEMIEVDDRIHPGADIAVKIQGNSMSPYINDGDTVFVRRQTELNTGDVGIFSVNGSLYCKLYYIDQSRNLVLVSANPDMQDSNVIVNADSSATVVCYGKVLLEKPIPFPDYFNK